MFVYLVAIVVLLLLVNLVLNHREKARIVKKIPGPTDNFLFGNALHVLLSPGDLFKFARKCASSFNGIYRFWIFPFAIVNIYNPEDIETIISSSKFNEKSNVYKFLKPWLREGLLLSKDAKWHHRRKILTPTFHFNILRQFFVTLEENSKRLVDTLGRNHGGPTDIVAALSEFTLHSICETAMGTRLHEETSDAGKSYKEALYELGLTLVDRFVQPIFYSDFLWSLTPMAAKQKKYLQILHNFTEKVVDEKKRYAKTHGYNVVEDVDDSFIFSKKKRTAMLDLLISAERDGLIDKIGIQEEVDTFMFEGHDTTAGGLTFFLMLLANNKHVQDKIVDELNGIFGDSSREASFEDLAMMKYLECCIKESLRLYPPVPFISRSINHTVKLSGYTVPADTTCHIHIYDLHRRPDLYKNPNVFDPDRFLPENSAGRHPYAYIPFSAGPRNCIGQKFAIMEMKSCVAAVLRNFELQPVTRERDLDFIADIVLRTASPVYVNFIPRN